MGFLAVFLAAKAISGGKLIIEVSYFGVHVHTETHDLCEETSCPVAAGDFVIAHTQTLPSFTPPVSFIIPTAFSLQCESNTFYKQQPISYAR